VSESEHDQKLNDVLSMSDLKSQPPEVPQELAILPLFNVVIYPLTVVPLAVGQEQSIKLIDEAMASGRMIGLMALKNEDERPEHITPEDFYQIGTAGMVHRLLRLPDDTLRVAIQGIERIEIEEIIQTEPYIRARVRVLHDEIETDIEIEALMRNLVNLATQILQLLPNPSEELQTQIINEEDPRRLAYLLAVTLLFRSDVIERQEILEIDDVREKLERLTEILNRELSVLQLGQQIQSQVQSGIDKNQRDYLLREQLRAIRKELGEDEENQVEAERLRKAIDEAGMSAEAREQAERELSRLAQMPPAAAEYGVIRSYIEWLTSMPWQVRSDDELDLDHAQQVLDEDHYDLEKIKARILEYLAVRELRQVRLGKDTANQKGAIICFVGPPGVGKTSLGRSIARAMNRKFIRISLGGVRDEAEVRGHRRTYIGAMPGTIIQTIKRVGVNNPVFMLDEIDKLGSDFRGDPSSALLEVLDPEQNVSFRDHYLDVAWDLSSVMFIATANNLQTIPAPLLDRMEVINLSGYTLREKMEIARRYLLPEQMKEHALTEADIQVTDEALQVAIEEYTREAGVRNLEREIANICRKVAVELAKHRELVEDSEATGESQAETPSTNNANDNASASVMHAAPVFGQPLPTAKKPKQEMPVQFDLWGDVMATNPLEDYEYEEPEPEPIKEPEPEPEPVQAPPAETPEAEPEAANTKTSVRIPSPEQPVLIDADTAREYLGKRRYFSEVSERIDRPGIVTGLVWTPVGGDIIFIEATAMSGSKGFTLTGQLGDVMKESASAALSWVRAEAERLQIDPRFYEKHDIHLHVPAGAIPKDGPSAGIAMATVLVSLLTGRPVRDGVAMTGEITLRGKVLPIGGVKEKVLAAHRAGLTTIILPKRNEPDIDDIPDEVRQELNFVFVDRVEEVLETALRERVTEPPIAPAATESDVTVQDISSIE
jgi:ATP-dependent Lon protease